MTESMLTAPVGRTPRPTSGDEVLNRPEDVDLLRRMLRANGFMVAEFGAVEPGLLKAIEAAQKKAGIKAPDGVIDPDGKTAGWLRPKFLKAEAARLDDEARLRAMTFVELKMRGERLIIEEREHQKLVDVTLARLEKYIINTMVRHFERLESLRREQLEVAMMERGFFKAIGQAVVINVYSVEEPDDRLLRDASRAVWAVQKALMQRDLGALAELLPQADAAVNAFSDEMSRYYRDFGGSAEHFSKVCGLTSTVSFGLIGVLAAPALVPGGALAAKLGVVMTPAQALVSSGAAVGMLSSMSKELGEHASGSDVTLAGSVWRVATDTVIGAATGWVGAKLPVGYVEPMAKAAAARFAGVVPKHAAPYMQGFLTTYLTGSGSDGIKSVVTESIGIVGKMAKDGRTPTAADFIEAGEAILFTFLTGGLMKRLSDLGDKAVADVDRYVAKELIPGKLERMLLRGSVNDKAVRKAVTDSCNAVSGEGLKFIWKTVLENAKGDESVADMQRMGLAALAKDRAFDNLVESELEKALKKAKVPLR